MFTEKCGIGFWTRSQRFALIAEDGVVKKVAVEEPMKLDASSSPRRSWTRVRRDREKEGRGALAIRFASDRRSRTEREFA